MIRPFFSMLLFVLSTSQAWSREMEPYTADDSTRALPSEYNHVQSFLFNTDYLRFITQLDQPDLREVVASTSPWPDSYWPIAKGGIGRRWADPSFPDSNDWLANQTYIIANPPETATSLNRLSPSEKYDLLVGDLSFTLSKKMWAEGQQTYEKQKKVPTWHGHCHGWAVAAFRDANPQQTVEVNLADGRTLAFYPSDLKALISRAWADNKFRKKFVGRRCNVKNPKRDEFGRVIDPDCFEINPATFHLGLVNQLGVARKSFVFDVSIGAEVWNHPVHSYQLEYFNPQTFETSKEFAGASVRVENFTADKFKRYRSSRVVWVIGVAMNVWYGDVSGPSSKPQNKLKLKSMRLAYDLELDARGEVIGGEWYANNRPDFMWHPAPETRPLSAVENSVGKVEWNGVDPLSPEIGAIAREASARGQVLYGVVEALMNRASAPEN